MKSKKTKILELTEENERLKKEVHRLSEELIIQMKMTSDICKHNDELKEKVNELTINDILYGIRIQDKFNEKYLKSM